MFERAALDVLSSQSSSSKLKAILHYANVLHTDQPILEAGEAARPPGAPRKVIVFSQFTTVLFLLRHLFEKQFNTKFQIFHGGLSGSQREHVVANFRDDPAQKFLFASLASGGVGLHLPFASAVLFCDVWWNSVVHRQVRTVQGNLPNWPTPLGSALLRSALHPPARRSCI